MPLTATDAFYANPFPTYEELENFILHDLPQRVPRVNGYNVEWNAEVGPNNHLLLWHMFESRLSADVVREVGMKINERGGMTAMKANFYVYCHFVGERLKDMGLESEQWCEMHYNNARHIESLWNGIGQWLA